MSVEVSGDIARGSRTRRSAHYSNVDVGQQMKILLTSHGLSHSASLLYRVVVCATFRRMIQRTAHYGDHIFVTFFGKATNTIDSCNGYHLSTLTASSKPCVYNTPTSDSNMNTKRHKRVMFWFLERSYENRKVNRE